VVYLAESVADHPEVAAGICSLCHMRERVTSLAEVDREAIVLAAKQGTLAGVKEVKERLGWSIGEAVTAVHVLRVHAEQSPATDRPRD
jgi:hypothetical protein